MILGGVSYNRQPSSDASGRLRTGQITTLGDLKTLNQDNPLLWETVGDGTRIFTENMNVMSVIPGKYLIRKSKHYFPYFSGKSQLVEFTFDNFAPQEGVTKRIGYFSSSSITPYDTGYDGFYIESSNDTIKLVFSRGGVVIYEIDWTNWLNYEKLSKYDWNNFTVVMCDFLWLGGANFTLWMKYKENFIEAHSFHFAGTSQKTFMISPNHPLRYEIRSTTGTGMMTEICGQVSTEGSTEESGQSKSVDTGSTFIAMPAVGTEYPILGIRKRIGYRDNIIKQVGMQGLINSNNDYCMMRLHLNPTLSSVPAFVDAPNTVIQKAVGTGLTVTSPGTILSSNYLSTGTVIPPNILEKDFLSSLGVTIDDVSDQLWICAIPLSGGVNVFGSIVFKEY